MYYKRIEEYEDDPFVKHKSKTMELDNDVKKYMKQSIENSKKAKNIYYVAKAYLLLSKMLNRRNKINNAIINIDTGLLQIKNSDYCKLEVDLIREKGFSYVKNDKIKEAVILVKNMKKKSKKNNDLKSVILLEKDLEEIENRTKNI